MYQSLSPSSQENTQRLSKNFGTNGTEQVGDARSNKDRRDVQDVKEYMYSQCHDLFDLSIVRTI